MNSWSGIQVCVTNMDSQDGDDEIDDHKSRHPPHFVSNNPANAGSKLKDYRNKGADNGKRKTMRSQKIAEFQHTIIAQYVVDCSVNEAESKSQSYE